ncbi:adenylate kinase domain containing protein 1 [Echinococcus multilocularis]|uniref:Adenylate kinase domain containing protein 1 n=1 Tax=Echinococcus multilocularis TaxID=6211 RepID=A0A087VWX2_ECHMU|nr:adenylate kinase domain containing protein 1 [Echinococcus multilocularis]
MVTETNEMEMDEDRELDAEANISEMLDEEMPEEKEEEAEDEETEGEAMARIEGEISNRVETGTANAEEVLEALTEAKIPHFSIRADDQLTRVRYRLVKKIKNLILNREAIFERVYPTTLEEGENLVASGFKHLSPFTRFCPVSWDRVALARLPPINPSSILRYSRLDRRLVEAQLGDEIDPNAAIKQSKKGSAGAIQTCCAVYRECVYWFSSEAERRVFMANPIAVIRMAGEQAQTLAHQPLQVAVIGGPTSEREFISRRLGTDLRVVYVTTTRAVQWLLSSVCQSWTALVEQIRGVIMSGAALCDDLVTKALRVALLAPQIQARGSIEVSWFDNWNNQEPPDCPFLKVWLNMKARRGGK